MTDVPGIGQVDQKYLWAGGALVVGIAGYAWFKRGSDPGVVPGVDTFPDAGTGGAPGYQNPDPNNPPSLHPGGIGSAPQTDVEWTQRVTETLGNLGYDVTALARVLGKYLTRTPLTPEEASWIQTAWAYVGKPPGGSYPIIPTPVPVNPPTPPAPATWKGPVRRKAAGGSVMSIKTLGAPGSTWTWAQLVPMFYSNPPPPGPKLNSAAAYLRAANAFRLPFRGTYKWGTYPTATAVTVPATLPVY